MQIFKALADETRVTILHSLLGASQPVCVCELKETVGKDVSVIYRHVKKLEQASLVTCKKDGRMLLSEVTDEDAVRKLLNAAEVIENDSTDPGQRLPEVQASRSECPQRDR